MRYQCLRCRSKTRSQALCSACQKELPYLASLQQCRICALPLSADDQHGPLICPECLKQPPAFDEAHAAFSYSPPINQWLHQLKYHGNLKLGRIVINQALPFFNQAPRPQLLVPVPMPHRRQWLRGFNQANWICRQLANHLGIAMATPLRSNQTNRQRQAQSNRLKRRSNSQNAFSTPNRYQSLIKDKHIALVDDIMTTGSTLRSASKILKDSGACRVDLWIIARTAKINGKKDKNWPEKTSQASLNDGEN
jgi:ComF family protein